MSSENSPGEEESAGGQEDSSAIEREDVSDLEDLMKKVEKRDDDEGLSPYRLKITETEVTPIAPSNEEEVDEDGNEVHLHTEPDYASSLREREVVAGDNHHLGITIENVGEDTFPGGGVSEFEISSDIGSMMTYPRIRPEIPEIEPEEEHEIITHATISQTGALTISIEIESDDERPTVFDIGEEEKDQGMFSFRSVEREKLRMVESLENIERNLENVGE